MLFNMEVMTVTCPTRSRNFKEEGDTLNKVDTYKDQINQERYSNRQHLREKSQAKRTFIKKRATFDEEKRDFWLKKWQSEEDIITTACKVLRTTRRKRGSCFKCLY